MKTTTLAVTMLIVLGARASNPAEAPISIRKVDWILLNARVDLLTDALGDRFPRSIRPPTYSYEPAKNRITAVSSIDAKVNAKQATFRQSLEDAAKIFCLQPHYPETILSPDPLPGVECHAEFYQEQGSRGSVSVASFDVPAPHR
jgi:hypothetical protein